MPMSPWNFTITGAITDLDTLQQIVEGIIEDDGGRDQELSDPNSVLDLIAKASMDNAPIKMSDMAAATDAYHLTRALCQELKLSYCETYENDYKERDRDRHEFWTPGMAKPATSSVQGRHSEILEDLLSKPLKEAVGRRVKLDKDAPERFPGVFHCPPELIEEARLAPLPAY